MPAEAAFLAQPAAVVVSPAAAEASRTGREHAGGDLRPVLVLVDAGYALAAAGGVCGATWLRITQLSIAFCILFGHRRRTTHELH